jgi:nucleotide-binding universal stress UspA family protein
VILVPLDGSELAEQALAVASARAQQAQAALHLVSVREPMPALALPPDAPLPMHQLEAEAVEDLQEYLNAVAARVGMGLSTRVVTAVVTGEPATALCEYVERHEVDLVVMTTHGRTGLSRLWMGSVADRMLRRLGIPVLLLHADETAPPAEFRQLVVALDGDIEQPLIDGMMALGARPGMTRCLLTRVVEPAIPVLSELALRPAHLPPNWTAKQVMRARTYLGRIADPLTRAGWEVDCQVLVGRGVAIQVLALAEACAADCIVVGTHGARGLERLFLGSVADKIVRGAKIPVLVAPVGHLDVEVLETARSSASRTISPARPALV